MCRLCRCERVRVNCCDINGSFRLFLNFIYVHVSYWDAEAQTEALRLKFFLFHWWFMFWADWQSNDSKCSAKIHRKDKDTEFTVTGEAGGVSELHLKTLNWPKRTFSDFSWKLKLWIRIFRRKYSISHFKVGLLQRRRWKYWGEETCLSSETRVRTCCQTWAA